MTVREITAAETKALLDRKEQIRLVDCREEDEFAFCRIEGAELIPFSLFAGLVASRLPDKEEPIVLYCHLGVRSARAALYLSHLGYTNVQSLAGGIEAWSREVDPTVPRY